jgi:hypothetical protein
MGLFRRRPVEDPLEPLRLQLAEVTERLGHLDDVERRLATAHAEKQALADRLALLERRVGAEHEQVQARLAEVGTVVTRQLGELSGDLGRLEDLHGARLHELEVVTGKLDPDALVSTEQLDEVRRHQAAIANELVRYELALRQDLALAVERLGPRRTR